MASGLARPESPTRIGRSGGLSARRSVRPAAEDPPVRIPYYESALPHRLNAIDLPDDEDGLAAELQRWVTYRLSQVAHSRRLRAYHGELAWIPTEGKPTNR